MTNLAKLIKKQRESLSISQGKLGRNLGFVNGQFISNIENSDDIQYPPVYFRKIAKHLGLSFDFIVSLAIQDYSDWLHKEARRSK